MNLIDNLITSPTGTIGIRCKWDANENFNFDIWVSIGNSMICRDIWHKYHKRCFKIIIVIHNFTSRQVSEI